MSEWVGTELKSVDSQYSNIELMTHMNSYHMQDTEIMSQMSPPYLHQSYDNDNMSLKGPQNYEHM